MQHPNCYGSDYPGLMFKELSLRYDTIELVYLVPFASLTATTQYLRAPSDSSTWGRNVGISKKEVSLVHIFRTSQSLLRDSQQGDPTFFVGKTDVSSSHIVQVALP